MKNKLNVAAALCGNELYADNQCNFAGLNKLRKMLAN
jgi:hypothetical protein